MGKQLTIENIRSRIEHTSLVCTEEAYRYPHLDLGFLCNKGHSFTMTWADMARHIRRRTVHCPLCKYGDNSVNKGKKP